jgi:hypothetical protein
MVSGNISLPISVQVSLDAAEWDNQEGTVDFDTVQENITTFVQDALDAWLLSRGLGHVER